jgi:hypothetical protein
LRQRIPNATSAPNVFIKIAHSAAHPKVVLLRNALRIRLKAVVVVMVRHSNSIIHPSIMARPHKAVAMGPLVAQVALEAHLLVVVTALPEVRVVPAMVRPVVPAARVVMVRPVVVVTALPEAQVARGPMVRPVVPAAQDVPVALVPRVRRKSC